MLKSSPAEQPRHNCSPTAQSRSPLPSVPLPPTLPCAGDFLITLLRDLVAVRRAAAHPLKVVLMSATLDSALFADYFGGCPVLHAQVWGRNWWWGWLAMCVCEVCGGGWWHSGCRPFSEACWPEGLLKGRGEEGCRKDRGRGGCFEACFGGLVC